MPLRRFAHDYAVIISLDTARSDLKALPEHYQSECPSNSERDCALASPGGAGFVAIGAAGAAAACGVGALRVAVVLQALGCSSG